MTTTSTRPLAVVTGASSGIGLELAKQFASNGYDLLIASGSSALNSAQSELTSFGSQVLSVQADLATYDGVEKLYSEIKATGRSVDAIAINAGVGVGGDFARQTDLKEELNLIQLNVTSTVHLAKRILKDMLQQGRGKVLFTSSIAATMPGPFEAVYAASKAFIYSFSLAIRNELKDTGITVTALMPGPTETNFFHRADMEDTKVGADPKKDDAAEVAEEGYEALMAGKDHIIAGAFKNKLQGVLGNLIPDTATAEIHRGMAEPGSARK